MYRIQSFIKSDNSLTIALGEAEQKALQWLHANNQIRLVSVSPSCVVADDNPDGRFTYIITVAYSTE